MTTHTALHTEDVVVTTAGGGHIGTEDIARARQVIARAAAHAAEPVLAARVRIVHHQDPARRQPYTARANLDVNGRMIHAYAVAATAGQAIDVLDDRLRAQVQRLARYRTHRDAHLHAAPAAQSTGPVREMLDESPSKSLALPGAGMPAE